MAFAQRTMQTPDPPNLNRCCWVRVYNPSLDIKTPTLTFMIPFPTRSTHDPRACGATPVTQGTVESGCGVKSTTAPPMTDDVLLYTNAPNCQWHQNGVHVDESILPDHGSIIVQCLTVFVPSAKEGPQSMQRHLHCTFLSLQSRLETVAYIALGQTDRHTNRHRHMLERVSLPFESVCLNQRWNQRYDNLATKPRRQHSALWAVLRVLWFTGHVDIPPIALKHTNMHVNIQRCKLPHTTHSQSVVRKPLFPPPTAEAGEPVEDF